MRSSEKMASLLFYVVLASSALCGTASVSAQTIVDQWGDAKAPATPPKLEQVTVDPAHTALLILDIVLPGCTMDKRPSCADSVAVIKNLMDNARAKSMPIIYTVTSRTSQADIVKDIAPRPDDLPVQKVGGGPDKFVGTDLKARLKAKGITSVIVTGSSAEGAVLYTASGAAMRGFKVIVPVDGMSSDALYQMQFTTWELGHAPTIPANLTLTRGDMIHF